MVLSKLYIFLHATIFSLFSSFYSYGIIFWSVLNHTVLQEELMVWHKWCSGSDWTQSVPWISSQKILPKKQAFSIRGQLKFWSHQFLSQNCVSKWHTKRFNIKYFVFNQFLFYCNTKNRCRLWFEYYIRYWYLFESRPVLMLCSHQNRSNTAWFYGYDF